MATEIAWQTGDGGAGSSGRVLKPRSNSVFNSRVSVIDAFSVAAYGKRWRRRMECILGAGRI